jgi:hypothetical protein
MTNVKKRRRQDSAEGEKRPATGEMPTDEVRVCVFAAASQCVRRFSAYRFFLLPNAVFTTGVTMEEE